MKTISPIKRHQALIPFSKDHHFSLLLVWKIRQGLKINIEPERISSYTIFFFERDLIDHFKQEEENLFSKLPPDDILRQQAFQEHEKIRGLINNLQKDKSNARVLNEIGEALEDHIRFEERVLFNHLQNVLFEDELIRGIESHGKVECNIDDKWNDHFWIGKKNLSEEGQRFLNK